MTGRIAYLHCGNNAQLRSFQDFSHYIDDLIYLGDLAEVDLSAYAAVVVPDMMDSARIAAHGAQLNDYVRDGGFLIVFFQGEADWIDVVDLQWRAHNVHDWLWWTRKERYVETHQPEPRHPLCDFIPLEAMSWHWGGAYASDPRARTILALDDGGCLFMDFPDLDGGRLMVATLDPHSHNGQRFMPATTRFLQGFYPWLNEQLGIERRAPNRFTYLQCVHTLDNWNPIEVEASLQAAGFSFLAHPHLEIDADLLAQTDILYLPSNYDEFHLASVQPLLLDFLARGGSMIICGEPLTSWLPFIAPFHAVPPRPFSNMKVRVSDDRAGFFRNMPDGFDGWQGIYGQYARGWTDMPPGAIRLTDVGPPDDPKPADWLWRYPTKTMRGGFVFMHNGDNLIRYPDHGEARYGLVRDICIGLRALHQGEALL